MTKAHAILIPLVAVFLPLGGEAHKGITSKFTYNADIHRIFLNRCSGCHLDGGVAPMSLMTYEDAFPWAEALRVELLGTLPSGGSRARSTDIEADTAAADDGFVEAAHRQISARELDMVLDWATGGTPEGDNALTPAPVVFSNDWAQERPHAIVALTPPFVVPADTVQMTHEYVVPLRITRSRDVARVEFRPGTPAIVRTAAISVRSKDGHVREIGRWHPQQTPSAVPLQRPLRLEAGSVVVARIRYKKTWKHEGQSVSDASEIGFYFTD